MFSSFHRLLFISVATLLLSLQVNAQDFDCSLVNKLDPNFEGTYQPDSAVLLARCYLSMEPESVTTSSLALVKLLSPINSIYELKLLDSMIQRVSKLDTSSVEVKKLLYSAIGDAARKQSDWSKSLKYYELAHKYFVKESDVVSSMLMISYVYLQSNQKSKARLKYRVAMSALQHPDLLSDEEYFTVFKLSSILLHYLGMSSNAIESDRRLIYSSRVSDRDKAKVAFNGLVAIASRRMCDSVRVYSKLILNNLDDDFARNDVYFQLMKCASHEDSIALGREYYSKFKLLDRRSSIIMKNALDFEYNAMMGNQPELRKELIKMWNDSTETNKQYFVPVFLRGYFRNEYPEIHRILLSYFDVKQNTEDIRERELIDELEVSQNLILKEAEALDLEAQVQKERETRKLQYFLAATLLTLLGVSLFALLSSRRKSKELANQNASINTLNRELNHRTSNQLGLAYELINDQQRYITDDAAKALLKRSESQLLALKTVNGFLAKQSDDKLELDIVLKKVCEGLQAASPISFSLNLDLAPSLVKADEVVKVCLVINELMHNSIKYAWPQETAGSSIISIQLERSEHTNRIQYSDNGGGDSGVVLGTAQGTSLIEALLADVDASILVPVDADLRGYEFGFEWHAQ